MITIDDIRAAQQIIAGRLHRTPLVASTALSARIGAPLHLKLESWQKTGSFKPRGVLTKIAALSQAERARGLVTASAGNHAQALAWAAAAEGRARDGHDRLDRLARGGGSLGDLEGRTRDR